MNKFGICNQSLIAVRNSPSERAEMVTQLLFGETYEILEISGNWTNIKIRFDNYEGWIDSKLIFEISKSDYITIDTARVTQNAITNLKMLSNNSIIKLTMGSSLINIDTNGSFSINNINYQLDQQPTPIEKSGESVVTLATQFLNTPYLWGGKSIFGIDCSGLTQVIYKTIGVSIPRDSSKQVNLGNPISFINEAKPGDLAFFDNNEGEIIHVGIISENSKIIHASGFVRIDPIDHQGIFNTETSRYSHKLRVIRRIIE